MHPSTVTISNAAAIMRSNFPTAGNSNAGRCSALDFDATLWPPRSLMLLVRRKSERPGPPHRERQGDREMRLTSRGFGLVSGTAQVRHLTVLIDRYAHDLDGVPIRGSLIRDVTFGHHSWNEFSDLTVEDIEEAGSSIRSERSKKKRALAKYRITQAVEARAIV